MNNGAIVKPKDTVGDLQPGDQLYIFNEKCTLKKIVKKKIEGKPVERAIFVRVDGSTKASLPLTWKVRASGVGYHEFELTESL